MSESGFKKIVPRSMARSDEYKCEIPHCNNKVAKITKGAHFSARFCEEHLDGVKCECNLCGKELLKRASRYMVTINEGIDILCKPCSDSIKCQNINKSSSLVEKECYFCKKKYMESFRNHGILFHGEKIHICDECNSIKSHCLWCGKDIVISMINLDDKNFCSLTCSSSYNAKYALNSKESIEKRNETNANRERSEKEIEASRQNGLKCKALGLGIFDPIMKLEYSKLGLQAQKEKKLGFWSDENQKRYHQIQKELNCLGFNYKYCEMCQSETLHNGNICTLCNPESGSFHVQFCQKCNTEVLFNGSVCTVCNPKSLGTLGKLTYNDLDFTNKIINNFRELFIQLEQSIVNYDSIKQSNISGVYAWFIKDRCFYVGESLNIYHRSKAHIANMIAFPMYWAYFSENEYKIEIRVLESITCYDRDKCKALLHERELFWVDKLKPLSQRCDGTDWIMSLHERNVSNEYVKLYGPINDVYNS